MANCTKDEQFFGQFQYLIRDLLRVTKPGRVLSFHCMNLPTSKVRDGHIGITDFRGELIRAFLGNDAYEMVSAATAMEHRATKAAKAGDTSRASRLVDAAEKIRAELRDYPGEQGWIYHSEVVIWKDPVTAMQRTKALGLLHKQIKKDSCMSRQGIPDYFVTMRKPGDNPEPVTHTDATFPVKAWQHYASPIWIDDAFPKEDWQTERALITGPDGRLVTPHDVWMNINPSDTLQYMSAREDADERHICPLQLEVIRRGLRMWTNPGDVVLSPFTGIGSEGYVAVSEGRKFVGAELKKSYFEQAGRNLAGAGRQIGLFGSSAGATAK